MKLGQVGRAGEDGGKDTGEEWVVTEQVGRARPPRELRKGFQQVENSVFLVLAHYSEEEMGQTPGLAV